MALACTKGRNGAHQAAAHQWDWNGFHGMELPHITAPLLGLAEVAPLPTQPHLPSPGSTQRTQRTLGVKVGPALAAAHGQRGEAVLEDLGVGRRAGASGPTCGIWRPCAQSSRALPDHVSPHRLAAGLVSVGAQPRGFSATPSPTPRAQPYTRPHLLKGQELEDGLVHGGVEAQAALQCQADRARTGWAGALAMGEPGASGIGRNRSGSKSAEVNCCLPRAAPV